MSHLSSGASLVFGFPRQVPSRDMFDSARTIEWNLLRPSRTDAYSPRIPDLDHAEWPCRLQAPIFLNLRLVVLRSNFTYLSSVLISLIGAFLRMVSRIFTGLSGFGLLTPLASSVACGVS
jgi:hypothetical protein